MQACADFLEIKKALVEGLRFAFTSDPAGN